MATPPNSPSGSYSKHRMAARQLLARVNKCWEMDFDWDLIPQKLKEVLYIITYVCNNMILAREYVIIHAYIILHSRHVIK